MTVRWAKCWSVKKIVVTIYYCSDTKYLVQEKRSMDYEQIITTRIFIMNIQNNNQNLVK